MSITTHTTDPLKSRWRDLPLELTTAIAKELGGEEVLRLRHELLPFDFSGNLILYNALVDVETWPDWASIREPLRKLGQENDVKDLTQELRKREALYWQHKKGVPRKLVASSEAYIDPEKFGQLRIQSLVRFGRLAYIKGYNSSDTIIVRDLVINKQIKIVHDSTNAEVSEITITKTALAYVRGESLHVCSLAELDDSVRTGVAEVKEHRIGMLILSLAGHEDLFAMLVSDKGVNRLYYRKGADGHFVANIHGPASVEVESDCFMVVKRDVPDESNVKCEWYDFDGHRMGMAKTCQLQIRPDMASLRFDGDHWTFMEELHQTTLEGLAVQPYDVVQWKDRMYMARSGYIGISDCKQNGMKLEPGKLIGNLVYMGHVKSWMMVDDTFLVIHQRDKYSCQHRWFVFTFEDLSGAEIASEMDPGRYYWVPVRREVAEKEDDATDDGWTRYNED